jgi:hypothetical protein
VLTLTTNDPAGTCPAVTSQVTLTVNPNATANAGSNATICSGTTYTLTGSNVGGGATTGAWSITSVTGSMTSAASQLSSTAQTNNPSNVTFTPISGNSGTVVLTLTTNDPAGTCSVVTSQVMLTVNPLPNLSNSILSQTICANSQTSAVTFTSSIPVSSIDNWAVSYASLGVTVTTSFGSGSSFPAQLISSTSNDTSSVKFQVTITSPDGCTNNNNFYTININPTPSISNKQGQICSGDLFPSFTSISSDIIPANTIYTWTSPQINPQNAVTGFSAVSDTSAFAQTLVNLTDSIATATYQVTPKYSTANCIGSTFNIILTANPKPVIGDTTLATACSGATFTYSPSTNTVEPQLVPNPAQYVWLANPQISPGPISIVTGVSAGTASSFSQTIINNSNLPQTLTYSVIPLSQQQGNCPGDTFNITFTVNPRPSINATVINICDNQSFSYFPQSGTNGIVPQGTTYSWNAPINASIIFGLASGNNLDSISGGPLNSSSNSTVNLTYTVTATGGAAVGACQSSDFDVVVNVNPSANISAYTRNICSGATGTFTPSPANNQIPNNTVYTWAFPNDANVTGESASQNPSPSDIIQTLSTASDIVRTINYTITPSTTGCIGTDFTLTINVNPTPKISNYSDSICSGAEFLLSPTSSLPIQIVPAINGYQTTYQWELPTGNIGVFGNSISAKSNQQNFNQTAINATQSAEALIYSVIPTSGSGLTACVGDTFQITLKVNPKPPTPDFQDLISNGSSNSVYCIGSKNINLNVINPTENNKYMWESSNNLVEIDSSGNNNNVLLQILPGAPNTNVSLYVLNSPNLGRCSSDTIQKPLTVSADNAPEIQKVVKKGKNLLMYLDNSVEGYQWGVDDKITAFKPEIITGQNAQVMALENGSKFINQATQELDTSRYYFWVMIYKGNCKTKVYYLDKNPFERNSGSDLITDSIPGQTNLSISPNPGNGRFDLKLEGYIFGNLKLIVFSSLGQAIQSYNLIKESGIQQFFIDAGNLNNGLYFIEVSDQIGQKLVSKLIIE